MSQTATKAGSVCLCLIFWVRFVFWLLRFGCLYKPNATVWLNRLFFEMIYNGNVKPYLVTHAQALSFIRPVSEMTYTVSSGTLNSTIPYHSSGFLPGADWISRGSIVVADLIAVIDAVKYAPSDIVKRYNSTEAFNYFLRGRYISAGVCLFVCLSVCLSVSRIAQKVNEIWWNLSKACGVRLARTD